MLKRVIGTGVALLIALQAQDANAGGLSANMGWNSEYIYRGIPQKSSSAFAGLDFDAGGFNTGVWAADVGDGVEIDYYGGYSFSAGDFGFSIGGTLYTFTGMFDDTYLELNLGVSWKWLSFDMASGQYDNFDGPVLDYQFYSLSASHNGFYGKIGVFEKDFDGTYYEAGYGNTLHAQDTELFDYGFAIIYSDATLLGGESDTNLVLTLSKSFSF